MNSPHLPPIQNILTRGTPLSSSLDHIQEGILEILDDDHVPDQNTCIENFSLPPDIKHVRIGFVREVKEKQKLTTVFRAFSEVTHIDFEHSGLLWLKKETLKSIFSHLGKVKTLNLRGNALNMLDQDELSAIFDPLSSLSSINLSTNSIHRFDEKKLAFLFSYFDAITSINLSCSLGTMLGSYVFSSQKYKAHSHHCIKQMDRSPYYTTSPSQRKNKTNVLTQSSLKNIYHLTLFGHSACVCI